MHYHHLVYDSHIVVIMIVMVTDIAGKSLAMNWAFSWWKVWIYTWYRFMRNKTTIKRLYSTVVSLIWANIATTTAIVRCVVRSSSSYAAIY
jgi:hypothetical protein